MKNFSLSSGKESFLSLFSLFFVYKLALLGNFLIRLAFDCIRSREDYDEICFEMNKQ